MSQPLLFVLGCAFVLTVYGLRQVIRYRRNRRMWERIEAQLPDVESMRRIARRRLAQIEAVNAARQRAKVPR